jgi:NAD(P)-dependent dehydrogenase (short-subunit alcohol dehydrogenase family)
MKRFGEPEELIGALLLLVSTKAGSFMTGAVINVDGGFTAAWF